jgi:hypothetical protein
MSYIELPILWKSGDIARLEELGIETDYEDSETKQVCIRIDQISWFFPDKNPRYTCIFLKDTEMVVDIPFKKFKILIDLN